MSPTLKDVFSCRLCRIKISGWLKDLETTQKILAHELIRVSDQVLKHEQNLFQQTGTPLPVSPSSGSSERGTQKVQRRKGRGVPG